ncbi:hypothetical protein [Ornithinimicrobium kibberense]|uniref:hypothetical protein n=1 Tax=Ornithinimicrobium kibberense TaxID=282060 RepID=UPI0036060755
MAADPSARRRRPTDRRSRRLARGSRHLIQRAQPHRTAHEGARRRHAPDTTRPTVAPVASGRRRADASLSGREVARYPATGRASSAGQTQIAAVARSFPVTGGARGGLVRLLTPKRARRGSSPVEWCTR